MYICIYSHTTTYITTYYICICVTAVHYDLSLWRYIAIQISTITICDISSRAANTGLACCPKMERKMKCTITQMTISLHM